MENGPFIVTAGKNAATARYVGQFNTEAAARDAARNASESAVAFVLDADEVAIVAYRNGQPS